MTQKQKDVKRLGHGSIQQLSSFSPDDDICMNLSEKDIIWDLLSRLFKYENYNACTNGHRDIKISIWFSS